MGDYDNNNQEHISLREAAKFCDYSQEYLSLRARQGKLKSVKLGRNWVTTKEWLMEYVSRAEEYNNSINNQKEETEKVVKDQIFHAPPDNLPIARYPKLKLDLGTLRPGFLAVLVLILIIAGGIFALRQAQGDPELVEWVGKESLFKTYNNAARSLQILAQNMEKISENVFTAAVNYKSVLASIQDILKEYGQWFWDQIFNR